MDYLTESIDEYGEDGAFNDMLNEEFTMSELQNSIKSLKLGKSGGLDGLVAEILLMATTQLYSFLCLIKS